MAIALVKAGVVANSAGATITPSFGQATTAGNTLIGLASGNSGSSMGVTGSGWSRIQTLEVGGAATIYWRQSCSAGEAAPTFDCASATYMAAVLTEWSGIGGLDQTNTFQIVFTAGATGGTVTCPAPDSSASNLAVSVMRLLATKSCTATFTDTWAPSAGVVDDLGNDGATKQLSHTAFSAYLLNGKGGAVADSSNPNATLSTGVGNGGELAIYTFFPTGAAVTKPLRAMQAVNRAATFFSGLDNKLPWRKRTRGGLFIPDLVTV